MDPVPTTDQLRNDIDSGMTGEKVRMPDPATVPLGTDAEAGGNTPTRSERALEAKARPQHHHTAPPNGLFVYLAALALVTVAIVLVGSLA